MGAPLKTDAIVSKAQPFGALIAPSTLVVAVLYLAGFSYRWSYYYNFGLSISSSVSAFNRS